MLRTFTTFILSVLAVVVAFVPAFAEKRVALVVGNSGYENAAALKNPRNDAADIAIKLRTHGFDVIEGTDLDRETMERKVREFSNAISDAADFVGDAVGGAADKVGDAVGDAVDFVGDAAGPALVRRDEAAPPGGDADRDAAADERAVAVDAPGVAEHGRTRSRARPCSATPGASTAWPNTGVPGNGFAACQRSFAAS